MKHKKYILKFFLFGILMFSLSSPVFSFSWENLGFSVKEKTENENDYRYIMEKNNKSVTVKSFEPVKEQDAGIIVKFLNMTEKFQYIQYESITFMLKNDTINASLIPTSYLYDKTSYIPYIPAGIQFIITGDSIQYNYRIKKESYFIKIKGDFVDDLLISQKMKKAVDNPSLYIKQRDPEFIANKLEQLEEELDSLRAANRKLTQNNDMLRIAVMTLHNKGLFSSEKPIPSKLIKAVVDYKNKFPKATNDQIEEYLEKEKIEASDKEIKIILFIYFNEFNND